MLTKACRQVLMEEFGYDSWPALRAMIQEAKKPYPYRLDYQAVACGKRKNGRECVHNNAKKRDPSIDASVTFEERSFVRFKGSDTIWRYQNSTEVRNDLLNIDVTGETDMLDHFDDTGGMICVMEPPSSARSREYAIRRKKAIEDGTWIVKPRGPNTEGRRGKRHHYRPY